MLTCIISLFWSAAVYAGPAVIFSGTDVKTLKPNIDLYGNSKLLSGATDPTSVAVSAPKGSLYLNNSNANIYRKNDNGLSTNWTNLGSGSGTVTSVALSLPNIFTVTGSPVTTTGTLTGTFANQTGNTIFSAPNGTTGTPTFRALVNADMPVAQMYSGYINGCTGDINHGGWSTTSTTFVDPTGTAGCALTSRVNNGFGTVTEFGTTQPGIVFTPPDTGFYHVCAIAAGWNGGTGLNSFYQLVDGASTVIANGGNGAAVNVPVVLCGEYFIGSVASTTIKVQMLTESTGTNHLLANTTPGYTLEFSIYRIK